MSIQPTSIRPSQRVFVAGIILLLVALVYWPAIHAGFVWDDIIDFQQMSWLTYRDEWKHYIFTGFNFWPNYFRPLVVALFTAQVRLFDSQPAPMHAVSLCMHLANTLLVGLLAWLTAAAASRTPRQKIILLACSMLLYGLHPVLIEAVTWIGCQFDLMATMFMLLGLLANILIHSRTGRAIVIGVLFLLAACCKESAAAFPLILAVHDWAMSSGHGDKNLRASLRSFVDRHWPTFAALFVAGLAYLALRHWALGQLLHPNSSDAPSAFGRFQEVCFLYLHYWRTLFVPMPGMNPIHPVDTSVFAVATFPSLLADVVAITMVTGSFYLALARRSALGCIVMVVTVALLPVLHIIPSAFDSSLYHDRYVLTGFTVACTMLPLVRVPLRIDPKSRQFALRTATLLGILWLVSSIFFIRTTIPLWSSNIKLWQWALTVNPRSVGAMDLLLSAYINARDYRSADALLARMKADHVDCTNCMLNGAILALMRDDPSTASSYLEKVRDSKEITFDRKVFGRYMQATGQMLLMQNKLPDAVAVLRASIQAVPVNPQPHLLLAVALAKQGKLAEARAMEQSGIAMLPIQQRKAAREAMNHEFGQLSGHAK